MIHDIIRKGFKFATGLKTLEILVPIIVNEFIRCGNSSTCKVHTDAFINEFLKVMRVKEDFMQTLSEYSEYSEYLDDKLQQQRRRHNAPTNAPTNALQLYKATPHVQHMTKKRKRSDTEDLLPERSSSKIRRNFVFEKTVKPPHAHPPLADARYSAFDMWSTKIPLCELVRSTV